MKTIFLALGSNLGDRVDNLRRAVDKLSPQVIVQQKSLVYESEPMYNTKQPRFYNMVLKAKTALEPHGLLAHAKRIESALGRAPDTHNEPRPIDIDILLYEDEIIETGSLTIPHPRMHERAFVLMPLEEIAPFQMHPVFRRPITDLWDDIGYQFETLSEAKEQL